MLQKNIVQPEVSREMAAPDLMPGAEALEAFVGFARRQLIVIVFTTIMTLVLASIYVVNQRPMYFATAQLLIDARKVQMFQQQSILSDAPIDTAQVESQVEILKSENIASAVIKNLHLTEDPEFVAPGGGLFGAIIDAVFNTFKPKSSEAEAPRSEFELFRSATGTFESRLSIKRIGLTYVIEIGFRSYNPERAAQIANAVADAYVVDQLEAKYQVTRRASAWLQDRIKELRDQVSTAERAVVDYTTRNNIVVTGRFGKENRLLGEQQVAELNSQLTIARANAAEVKARLDRINSVLKSDRGSDTIGATVSDTLKNEVVSKLRSHYLDLSARYADFAVKYGPNHLAVVNLRNQMRETRKSIYEELKRLGETYKSDYEIAKQRLQGIQNDLSHAVSQSQATDVKSVTLRGLQSTAQTYKTIYDNFLQRYMEAVQQQSFPITEARLISSASRPLGKSSPRTMRDLLLACLGGLTLGFGIGILRDLTDRVFRSNEQVESLLRTECIALVPLVTAKVTANAEIGKPDDSKANPGSRNLKATARDENESQPNASSLLLRGSEAIQSLALISDVHGATKSTKAKIKTAASSTPDQNTEITMLSSGSESSQKSAGPRTIAHGNSATWAIVGAPLSRFTESIRSIKLANDLSAETTRGRQIVGFTSSLPNEGKSTIAHAFAQLHSQVGARTILVDCDLRNPSLSRELAPRAKIGFLEVLSEKATIEEAVWKDASTNMTFLPIAAKFRLAHSTEVLSSAAGKKLFQRLRESYECIVVDLPPLAPIVDVHAAAHLIDSFVFIIEWGRTKIDVVQHTLGHAHGVCDNLLGVVLNKVDMNIFGRYAAHRNSMYYNKHYQRYGYHE
jgi:succinoglycan biosynthesis transport protein ExoP